MREERIPEERRK